MYSDSDLEKLWFLYKTEGEPKGFSINSFCDNQGVSYDLFSQWFRKTRKKIAPVQIEGIPLANVDEMIVTAPENCKASHPCDIQVTIHTGNGLHISQSHLDYRGLKALVEKLEGLC